MHPSRVFAEKNLGLLRSRGYEDATGLHGASDDSCETIERISRKDHLSEAYQMGQYLFGTVATLLFLIPDRTMTKRLASKLAGVAGFGTAAGTCHILACANEHNRLGSDTYKRLNIGLFGFSMIGLASIPGEAGFCRSAGAAMIFSSFMGIVRLFATVVSFMGWKRGIDQRDGMNLVTSKMTNELWKGTKRTFEGLKVQHKKKALTYRNSLILVLFGVFSSFMEGLFKLRYRKALRLSWFDVSLQWSAIARLFLISTMIYSLKDAAERDRLTGSTFIELNILVGCWALLVAMGQSIWQINFVASRGVEFFAFSMPFFIKAIKSVNERNSHARISPTSK